MKKHIVLIFSLADLPKLNSDERQWTDAILECLRGNNPSALPDGVIYVPDFKQDETLPLKPDSPTMQNRQPNC